MWILNRITKHGDEDRLVKVVDATRHLATLAAEGVGVVEDRGDPALLIQWR
ncbi:MAG: hypothetical protein ACLP4W_09890 [Mycobacterium sp.]|uniref:hypothetical protein n=1 Tax=Mycobacterium sp. TaxID=1785 RepID=UPI003F98D97E